MSTPFAAEHMAAEISRLRVELEKANAQSEHFEREWYLRGDEIEKLKERIVILRGTLEIVFPYVRNHKVTIRKTGKRIHIGQTIDAALFMDGYE